MKNLAPYLFLAVLVVLALAVRYYQLREEGGLELPGTGRKPASQGATTKNTRNNLDAFRDPKSEYFFTKHARCRMACRNITQKEVKEIVKKADVNYNKSQLDAARGPKYAVEGYTARDRQHIRVIVAPKQRHLSIVTVIDLDKGWECPSCN
jgi:hypothetical protein